MRFSLALTVLTIAAHTTVAAQASDRFAHRADAATVQQLMQIERDIGTANVARNKQFFETVEGEEFLFTGSDGSVTPKAEDVASLDAPPGDWRLVEYTPDDMTVYRYGDTAVVFGRTTSRVRNEKTGEERTRQSRFTDVFVHRNGAWQIVAGHGSNIPNR